MDEAQSALTVIAGAAIGGLIRSGVTPDDIRQMVDDTLAVLAQADPIEMKRLALPIQDWAITAVLKVQNDL